MAVDAHSLRAAHRQRRQSQLTAERGKAQPAVPAGATASARLP